MRLCDWGCVKVKKTVTKGKASPARQPALTAKEGGLVLALRPFAAHHQGPTQGRVAILKPEIPKCQRIEGVLCEGCENGIDWTLDSSSPTRGR